MADTIFELLQEDPPPLHAVGCNRCDLAQHGKRIIWGEGNPDAPIFILMDNPGLREDREGNAFLCGTRETLQAGIREAGLALDMVYVSFLLKRRPTRAYNKPLARKACFSHLLDQFSTRKHQVLLGLGNTVVQSLYPDGEADVKSYRGSWHTFQGTPAAFSYHPLAVRRRPNLLNYFIEDLKLVAQKVKEN